MNSVNYGKEIGVFNKVSYPFCIINYLNDMEVVFANDAFYHFLEYTEEEMRYKFKNSMTHLFDHETMKKVNEFFKQNQSLQHLNIEHKLKRKFGKEVWVLNEINRIDFDGCVFMTLTDITKYKCVEEVNSFQEKKQSFVLDVCKIDAFEYDFKTRIFRLPHRRFLFEMFGCVSFLLVETEFEKKLHPESLAIFHDNIKRVRKEKKDVIFELQIRQSDDHYCWYRISTEILDKKDAKIVFGVVENIEKEKELMFQYVNEAQYFQAMLSKQEAYGQIDVSEDKIIKVGGIWSVYNEIIGTITFTDLAQGFIEKVVHQEDRAYYSELMRCDNFSSSFANGITYFEGEFRRIVKQNKMVWIKIFIHLFRNPINDHVMGLLYLRDINEQKRRELSAYHQNEVENKNRIQNRKHILTAITNYLQAVKKDTISGFMLLEFAIEKDNDENIALFSRLLSELFRRHDFVSRLKNNEFVVFIKDVESHSALKNRIKELQKRISELNIDVVYHLGIALAQRGQSFVVLYKQATIAKEQAKEMGDNTYMFYQLANEDNSLTKTLNEAVDVSDKDYNISFDDFDQFVGENGEMTYLIEPDTHDLLFANKAFYDRIGKSESECIDMKCYEAVHNRKTPCPFCARANWSSDKFYIYRNYNEVLEQEFLVKNRLVNWNGSQVVLAIAVDLSNDKNIIDSMENGTTENGYILSGIQHLQTASSLHECMIAALETVGEFFRADCVRLWKQRKNSTKFEHLYHWTLDNVKESRKLTVDDFTTIANWQKSKEFNGVINIDNVEQMMTQSLPMCEYMNRCNIHNQRWFTFIHDNENFLFSIDNITINFANNSFLDSFSMFVFNEMHNRDVIQTMFYHATHDKLTQAYNRDYYEKEIVTMRCDHLYSIATVVVNINNFKIINSERGFHYGNFCLIKLVSFMHNAFNDDIVIRLSGDEFIVILENTPISVIESKISRLNEAVKSDGSFTISTGYAWDNVEKDINELTTLATSMMRTNKKIYYDIVDKRSNDSRLVVLNGLVNAIENREFEVFLQPKYDNKQNRYFGAEALIRYRHPEYGYISPIKFIEPLEKDNMIRYIDLFVFEEVCKTLQKWQDEKRPMLKISCNLSRLTLLETDIVQSINAIFNQFNISKDYIELEITENDTAIGKAVLFQNALKLHAAGYRISLDDFGTKHTNLNILSDIEVDVLKIDKSLINSLAKNKKKQCILKNIIAMCMDLNIQVIAEGVETKEQEAMLSNLQCYLIQGYLYGKPMPIDEFVQTIFE